MSNSKRHHSPAERDRLRQAAAERLQRIGAIGAFGQKRTRIEESPQQYSRKCKHTKGPQGPFAFMGARAQGLFGEPGSGNPART